MNTLYRIAVVGDAAPDSSLWHPMGAHLGELVSLLQALTTEKHPCKPVCLTAGESLSPSWRELLEQQGVGCQPLPQPREISLTDRPIPGEEKRKLVQISDMADLVLGFWDEDPDGAEWQVWELFHRCMEKGIPCIWLSKRDGSDHLARNSLHEPYHPDQLEEQLRLCLGGDGTETVDSKEGWLEKLALFANRQLERSLAREKKKASSTASGRDCMMEDAPSLTDPVGASVHRQLLAEFRRNDERAIHFSNLYRGSIYWRCSLPLWSTIFLSLAFYADSILFGLNETIAGQLAVEAISSEVFLWVAGIAFLLNAILILLSGMAERSRTIRNWHTEFLHHRVMAEVLRFYLHVLPYGVTLPLNRSFRVSGFDFSKCRREYGEIWGILHRGTLEQPVYREENAQELLERLSDYVAAQLEYHRRSAARTRKITESLQKRRNIMVNFSAAVVLLRGVAQFLLVGALNLPRLAGNPGLQSSLKMGRSLSNMAAMVLPGIGGYLSGKLSLTGFEETLAVDLLMEERLLQAQELLNGMKGHPVNYSMVRNLAEKLEVMMLSEVTDWASQLEKRKIKSL